MKIAIAFVTIVLLLFGCKPKQEISFSTPSAISSGAEAGGAFFSRDHLGRPILCWTEGKEGYGQLFFSRFDSSKQAFTTPVAVAPSAGTGIHGESMNKIAIKPDGTIIAVYERKHPTPENKYAGSILYTQSFDNGMSWTAEKFLHTDTMPSNSRSFFDITTLTDGEVGAVWLDSRLKLGKEGSSLFFARTSDKEGFQKDYQVGETVCECCRTDLYVDNQKQTHIIFRDIESTIEGQVRDFAHIVSSDNGISFSKPEKISNDKWIIDGCPHTGASITSTADGIAVTWFTAGGNPGLYFTSMDKAGGFNQRELLSANARHPQTTSVGRAFLAVWEESTGNAHESHGSHGHHDSGTSGALMVNIKRDDGSSLTRKVEGSEGGEFPVALPLDTNRALIGYTRGGTVIYQIVSLP